MMTTVERVALEGRQPGIADNVRTRHPIDIEIESPFAESAEQLQNRVPSA